MNEEDKVYVRWDGGCYKESIAGALELVNAIETEKYNNRTSSKTTARAPNGENLVI